MRKILFLFLFTLIQLQIFGQTEPGAEALQPLEGEGEDAYMPDSLLEVHNALKLDPLQIFRGEFSVFYERRISDRISIEVGAGFTRRNWSLALFDLDADDLRRNIDVHTQFAGRLGVRYYFLDSPELNGLYLMPQVAYRVFEKTFNELDSTGSLNGVGHLDRREIVDFNLCVGFQKLSLTSNFLFDIYVGLGYGQQNNQEVSRLPSSNQSLYITEPKTRYGLVPMLGLKFGWGF